MKKFISLFFAALISLNTAIAADMKFVQVDGVRYNADDTKSVSGFENIIKNINNEKNVDFVIFTGNNIAKADEKYLRSFIKKANKLKAPYYVVLGNKDVNKRKSFGKIAYMKALRKHVRSHRKIKEPNYVFEKNNVVFLVADGSKEVVTLPNGYYKPGVLSWIDEKLNLYADKNVVIIQHFPIVPPAEKENYYTFKSEDYLKMLSSHKNVKAIVSGHFNVNKEEDVNGILHISTAEAPGYRIVDIIDYDTENPTFWSTLK